MRFFCPFFFAAACMASVQAEEGAKDYDDLLRLLRRQQQILTRMEDASSVEAGLSELSACLSALGEMRRRVDEAGLWGYISNTEGAMQPLVDTLEMTSLQFQRLMKYRFYGNRKLESLLKSQLQPKDGGSSSPSDIEKARLMSSDER